MTGELSFPSHLFLVHSRIWVAKHRRSETPSISVSKLIIDPKKDILTPKTRRQDLIKKDSLWHGSYEATGSESTFLANRVSWFFDLAGPSISLDTACSSSLMALHLACQSLRSRESSMVRRFNT